MIASMMLALALFAPAPSAPKPPKPLLPVGEWELVWTAAGESVGVKGPCRFSEDGSFACVWNSKLWIGLWRMEKGVLHVREWIPADNETVPQEKRGITWVVELEPGKLEGKMTPEGSWGSGGSFALRKQP